MRVGKRCFRAGGLVTDGREGAMPRGADCLQNDRYGHVGRID
jgi:hypothetical protein